jgi:cysteinyl-tRNA synthetase
VTGVQTCALPIYAPLGLFGQEPEAFLNALRALRARRRGIDAAQVEALLEERRTARAAKDFARSDSLRQALQELGVSVRDTPQGQAWDLE